MYILTTAHLVVCVFSNLKYITSFMFDWDINRNDSACELYWIAKKIIEDLTFYFLSTDMRKLQWCRVILGALISEWYSYLTEYISAGKWIDFHSFLLSLQRNMIIKTVNVHCVMERMGHLVIYAPNWISLLVKGQKSDVHLIIIQSLI